MKKKIMLSVATLAALAVLGAATARLLRKAATVQQPPLPLAPRWI